MPIIDPSLQCCLVKNFHTISKKDELNFLLYYLRVASINMNRNIQTVETSILFKDDLKKSIIFLNDELGCNFKIGQDFNFAIKDFYKYLYKRIVTKSDKNKMAKTHKGSFIVCDDKFHTRLYKPSTLYHEQHAWFLSDTPIAILCINDQFMSDKFKRYVKLEVDLMSASGFTLVLCAVATPDTTNFYLELIKDNQFAEIHLNIYDDSYVQKFYKTINEKGQSHLDHFKGYIYLYSHFPGHDIEDIIADIKKRPRFFIISFNKSLGKTFKKIKLFTTKPFLFCKTGFTSEYLRIRLSNVPLYNHSDSFSDFISTEVSGISLAYISPDDFLRWSKKRIKILFCDQENGNHHVKKYINFQDIHKIRPDLYANKIISLKNIPKQRLREVRRIQRRIKRRDEKNTNFRKELLFSLFHNQKIREGLEYVGYAYTKSIRDEISHFELYDEQILTAIEACQTFVTRMDDQNDKGMIYQVDTGEGKSCIVCLIAAVLALMGKTVHITSSNIKLANRDYYKSFKFFRMLGFESAILLHDNELPFSLKDKKSNNDNSSGNINVNISLDEMKKSSKLAPDENKSILDDDKFFGYNSSSYLFNTIQSENAAFKSDYYPDKFFKPELFKNPSRMNFSVCGIDNTNKITKKNKANIIFSTFVNFECLYLRMMETCRGYVDEYFSSCGLLIDEVDSILIDEVTNGTIVSHEMKSNAIPILKYVYKQQRNNVSAKDTYNDIVDFWPNHGSLDINDVEQMYEEIELVNESEFSNGRKYYVDTLQVKNSSKIKRFIKKTSKFIQKATEKFEKKVEEMKKKAFELEKQIFDKNKNDKSTQLQKNKADNKKNENQNEEEEEEEEEEESNDVFNEEEEIADSPVIEFKHIVPFDYDHKGILEPNKEFSGFIQQFIAIKESEMKGNENMIIKDLSMNYLYVSHPIFVKLYGKVCGFTGTIGAKTEQQYYKNLYHLQTRKVPRHMPNLRVELPKVLCDSIEERNKAIVDEIKAFHDKGFPVLVIFQDLLEIAKVQYLLNSNQINFINIFDGKDELIRPDKIAGVKGAVSLGTNVCGRGTDIRIQSKPLHVILTYYSLNKRVMRQAFGRTARQGQKGTYRVICLKQQFYDPIQMIDGNEMDTAIKNFEIKNKQQEIFVDYFKTKRPWIFSGQIAKQKLTASQISTLRKAKINVNRIVAYNYRFPICMTTKTFLKIQAQKIFSIFNCPNSKYTWILFQRYLREMILESWSLMLNKFDQQNADKQGTDEYEPLLIKSRVALYKEIEHYIKYPKTDEESKIVPTFMHIFNKVVNKYQKNVIKIYKKMDNRYRQWNSSGFISCQFGFRPYSLLTNSGARIGIGEIGEMNYIIDPELRYERKTLGGRITILSITERIDDIFNKICQIISQAIGRKIGLKFFLRRTLGGCEFGICFDAIMKVDDPENEILNDFYCLVDKDPLLSFTIFVKNAAPILAGILIIVLVFIAAFSKKIAEWIVAFPIVFTKEIAKKGLKLIINYAADKVMTKILDKLFVYLSGIVEQQIEDLKSVDGDAGLFFENLLKVFKDMTMKNIGKKMSKELGAKIKVKSNFSKFMRGAINPGILLKVGILLLLTIGLFMMNFNSAKQSLKNESKDAKVFDKHSNPQTVEKLRRKNKNKVKLNDIEKIDNDNQLRHGLAEFKESLIDSFLFQMELTDTSQYLVKEDDFKVDMKPESTKNRIGNAIITYFIQEIVGKAPKKCFRIQYYGNTKEFKQEVVLLATLKNPAIVPFIGFNVERKNDFIYYEYLKNGFLDEYIEKIKKDDWIPTKRLIIAYGIAYVMKYLHDCHVVHRDLRPENVCLNDEYYPYIFNFFSAKQIDKKGKSKLLHETSLRFMAPEFIENPALCQNSFKLDVYSYGMLLYNMVTGIKPFESYDKKYELMNAIVSGERPEFPYYIFTEWKELISKCWDQEPDNRPTFQEILNDFDSPKFMNNHFSEKLFKKYKNKIKIK